MEWEIVLLLVLGLPFALCSWIYSGILSGIGRLMNNGAPHMSVTP